jgi:hypothetical protein
MSRTRTRLQRIFELLLFGNGILAFLWFRYWRVKIETRGDVYFWCVVMAWFSLCFLISIRGLWITLKMHLEKRVR